MLPQRPLATSSKLAAICSSSSGSCRNSSMGKSSSWNAGGRSCPASRNRELPAQQQRHAEVSLQQLRLQWLLQQWLMLLAVRQARACLVWGGEQRAAWRLACAGRGCCACWCAAQQRLFSVDSLFR
jgi:hypothetical protein